MKLPCLFAAIILLVSVASAGQQVDVSQSGAIRTLLEARDAAREQRHAGFSGPITILVHNGTYYLHETLNLGPEDSNTIWQAAPREHPVISGGRVVAGWTKKDGRIWQATAPGPYFRQLFINGRRATRARTPNFGFYRIDGDSSRAEPFQLHFRGDDIQPEWASQDDVEVVVSLVWSDLRIPISRVNPATYIATLNGNPAKSNHEQDARYYIENAPGALDAPGEWYLDRATSLLSYIPVQGEDMEHAVVVAPSLGHLIAVHGNLQTGEPARDIVFRGLVFEHADWTMGPQGYADPQAALPASSAIETNLTRNFIIDHCTVAHSGAYGLTLGTGSRNSQVLASEFFDLGAGGIRIGDGTLHAADTEQNYGNIIADNNIHDLGLVYAGGTGILVMQSSQNQILHNHVHDLFYTAISVGWTWGYAANQAKANTIAFNHVHDIGKGMLSDMGGIYTLGEQPGTVIRNNLVHDIASFTYGGWGIYTDEGSSEILIENNIVYNCKSAGFHQHYGRENILRNNIFAFNRDAQLMRTKSEDHSSFTFEHNIVYFNEGTLLGQNWKDNSFKMRDNIYYDTRGPNILFAGRTFAQWQAAGEDEGSRIADPLFINSGNFDFHLRPGSPALKSGFRQIDMSTVGPRTPSGADAWQQPATRK